MTECAKCGDCCEAMVLTLKNVETAKRIHTMGVRDQNKQWSRPGKWPATGDTFADTLWMTRLIRVCEPYRDEYGRMVARYTCPDFDAEHRLCSRHTTRPKVCRGFPWYGRPVSAGDSRWMSPRCSFIADDPAVTLLPIVEVSHGHQDRGPEDVRHGVGV